MDHTLRSDLLNASAVVVSFNGTMTHLNLDWQALSHQLAAASQTLGHPWDAHSTIDINLHRIRRESEDDYHTLCGIISEAEQAGFDAATVNSSLVALLSQRPRSTTAIVTSHTRAGVRTLLRHDAFGSWHPQLIAKEDVWKVKPDTEGLSRLFDYLDASPITSIYIGHDLRDKHAAETEGMRFIWVEDLRLAPDADSAEPNVASTLAFETEAERPPSKHTRSTKVRITRIV